MLQHGLSLTLASARPFSPLSIPGLAAWYDASRETDNTQATDWSGNGRHATQATVSQRPAWNANQQNGRPVWTFDGVDDWYGYTATSVTIQTFIVVALYSGAGGTLKALVSAPTDLDRSVRIDVSGTNYRGTTNTDMNDWSFNNGSKFFVNGTNANGPTTTAHVVVSERVASTSVTWGLGYQQNYPARRWEGQIGEFLIYGGALSDNDRRNLQRYLGSKWGITVA